jgi:hypothetical protein
MSAQGEQKCAKISFRSSSLYTLAVLPRRIVIIDLTWRALAPLLRVAVTCICQTLRVGRNGCSRIWFVGIVGVLGPCFALCCCRLYGIQITVVCIPRYIVGIYSKYTILSPR